MPRKPANLIYGVDDTPPLTANILIGLQHICLFFIGCIFPVLIVRQIGDSVDLATAEAFVSLSMIAGGVVTILQALRKGPLGSGYLCPSVCGPSYISASMMAAGAGGLPLVFGMTGFVGVVEVIFSRIMHKLRFMFPTEVTGVVVMMVGVVIIPLSTENFFGLGGADRIATTNEIITGVVTLAVMVGLNVYSKGKLRLYCTLIGMAAGYLLALALGIMPAESIAELRRANVFAVPYIRHMSWSFDASMMIPFVVATICSTLKTVGDLVTCQKINDADWKRNDMDSIAGGIFADGLGGILPGLIGGFGQSTSSSNVGMSVATGATSRTIAYAAGIMYIVMAFFPKLAHVFIIMPKPVIGATLIFAVSFMIIAGLQIITSRMLDSRKIFVVGTSLIFGLSADLLPDLYAQVHPWIRPLFSSSLSLATVTAIVLNLILRIGIAQSQSLTFVVGEDDSSKIINFMEKQGGLWGVRREVLYRAVAAMNEFAEGAHFLDLEDNTLEMKVSFDEFNLDIEIRYRGKPFEYPNSAPSQQDLLVDERALACLSCYLVSRSCDSIKTATEGEQCVVKLHLEH